jgi:hypothetical protein
MLNPTHTIAAVLTMANNASGDPRLTFVNLLTAAVIAGKFIDLTPAEIAAKIAEVDGPADLIIKEITGG